MGCGATSCARWLIDRGADAVGLDLSAGMLAEARLASRRTGTEVPLVAGRGLLDGRAAAYVCERFACQAPVADPDALRALLSS